VAASKNCLGNIRQGQPNLFSEMIARDSMITRYLSPWELERLFDVQQCLGNAPDRALALAGQIAATIAS
jgi:hypothetical protein